MSRVESHLHTRLIDHNVIIDLIIRTHDFIHKKDLKTFDILSLYQLHGLGFISFGINRFSSKSAHLELTNMCLDS